MFILLLLNCFPIGFTQAFQMCLQNNCFTTKSCQKTSTPVVGDMFKKAIYQGSSPSLYTVWTVAKWSSLCRKYQLFLPKAFHFFITNLKQSHLKGNASSNVVPRSDLKYMCIVSYFVILIILNLSIIYEHYINTNHLSTIALNWPSCWRIPPSS